MCLGGFFSVAIIDGHNDVVTESTETAIDRSGVEFFCVYADFRGTEIESVDEHHNVELRRVPS